MWRSLVLVGVVEHDGGFDAWVEAAVDGAVLDDFFESRAMLVVNATWEVDYHRQFGDFARRFGGHVFFNFDVEASQV